MGRVEQVGTGSAGSEKAELGAPPLLWHLKVSHYNEKARWALDYKRIPHRRQAAVPGQHDRIAEELWGGRTFPVLVLDGEAIGDSTRIIEELERRHPEPPLYPGDPDDRRRALELEDFFDEELGAYTRLLAIYHALPDGKLMLGMFVPDLTGARKLTARAMYPLIRRRVVRQFGIDDESIGQAWSKVRAAGERFRAELQPSGYLVGSSFTVADLTAAALVAPVVAPEQYPYPQPQRGHPLFGPVREAIAQSGMLDWARDIYARHRGRSAEIRD
jgi:glutathione S-transferase